MKRPKKRAISREIDNKSTVNVRFEATIHAGRNARGANWADHLDIDRVPDAKGRVRALITADDCVRLLNQGLEIRLYAAHPIDPLNPALIEKDESVRRWLDEQLSGMKDRSMPKPFIEPEDL
jgi:hypothetical protein